MKGIKVKAFRFCQQSKMKVLSVVAVILFCVVQSLACGSRRPSNPRPPTPPPPSPSPSPVASNFSNP